MDYALCILAGEVCLQIGPEILALCKPLQLPLQPGHCGLDEHATWLCKSAGSQYLFFTLFKNAQGCTLLYSHCNEMLYYASAHAQLSLACPPFTAFLCQFTLDTHAEGRAPRLLVFDTLAPSNCQSAHARGELLRSLAPHLPQPLCAVQWVGFRRYLTREFVSGLPHDIQAVISLGDNPLRVACVEAL